MKRQGNQDRFISMLRGRCAMWREARKCLETVSAKVWTVLVMLILLSGATVQAHELLLELRPEPGVVVRITREPNWQTFLNQPFGGNIVIPRPGKRELGLPPPELRPLD